MTCKIAVSFHKNARSYIMKLRVLFIQGLGYNGSFFKSQRISVLPSFSFRGHLPGEFGGIVPHAAVLRQQLKFTHCASTVRSSAAPPAEVGDLTPLHCTHGASKCKTKIS